MTDEEIVKAVNQLAKTIYGITVGKGFWDAERNDGEMIALMHSELSEALEGLRHGDPPDQHLPEYKSSEVELADCIVRILDMAHGRGLRVAEALMDKIAYNARRPHLHGKSF